MFVETEAYVTLSFPAISAKSSFSDINSAAFGEMFTLNCQK